MILQDVAQLPPTMTVDQVAELWGCSTWAVYAMERHGKTPVRALRLGRKMRWPTLLVLRSIGIEHLPDGAADQRDEAPLTGGASVINFTRPRQSDGVRSR